MIVEIVAAGKLREPYIREGCAVYRDRLAPYYTVRLVEIRQLAAVPSDDDSLAQPFLSRMESDARVWALERTGRQWSSVDLARAVAREERSGARRLVIAVGGADGLPRRVLARANLTWSLSALTFLHEMARLIALEQLYRAAKINRGEPYHR